MLLSRKGVAAGYYSPYKPVRIIFYTYQVTFIYITCDDKLIVVRNISDLFFGAGSSRAVTVGTALAILVCAGSCWAITVGSALAILLSASSRWAIAVSTALSVVLCHCCKLLSSDQIWQEMREDNLLRSRKTSLISPLECTCYGMMQKSPSSQYFIPNSSICIFLIWLTHCLVPLPSYSRNTVPHFHSWLFHKRYIILQKLNQS